MMRIIKLTLCVILLGVITLNAQENQKSSIQFGIKGAVNLSKFRDTPSKYKIGYAAGLFTQYSFSEKIAFQSEIVFSTQGAKLKSNSGKVKLNYINIAPALIKFYPIDKLNFQAGPQIGYLLSGKGAGFQKKDFKKFDYGMVLGVGYSISDNLEIGIQYNHGLADVSKIGTIKNSVVQFSFALKL